jgi:lysophospholipase L1-like esterase
VARWLAVALLLAALPAPAQPPSPFAQFRQACAEARRGNALARVSFYGASHTAPDVLPDRLRSHLQRRCGDGGPGWVIPAQPFAFYDHQQVTYGGRGWEGRAARGRRPARDHYGLAGIALEGPTGARATVRLAEPASLTVHLHRRPGGGTVRLRGSGLDREVETDGAAGVVIADAGERSRLRLEVLEGAARVFGVVAEHESGVVVDNFGVPGARVRNQLRWREASVEPSVRERPPDLWILAYGTNESIDGRVPIARYRQRLRRVIASWKRRAPDASCLLVGPGDWPRERRGTLRPRPRLGRIVEAQRTEADAAGCAFFDTLAWMGGPLSMERWVAEGLALGDRVHFTDAGYERLGDALAAEILR